MNSNATNNLLVLAQQMRGGRFYILTTILNQQKVFYSYTNAEQPHQSYQDSGVPGNGHDFQSWQNFQSATEGYLQKHTKSDYFGDTALAYNTYLYPQECMDVHASFT